jgi:signal transduction histidine kinase
VTGVQTCALPICGRLHPEQLEQVGAAIVSHLEALSSLVDDLGQVSRLAVEAPVLVARPVELAAVVGAAMADAGGSPEQLDVRVPAGLKVMADADGLERAVRDVVADAVRHGGGPVVVEVEGVTSGELQLAVVDQGRGLHPGEADERVGRARALVEAMGGRVWYDAGAEGAGRFRLTLPVPNRRRGDDAIQL